LIAAIVGFGIVSTPAGVAELAPPARLEHSERLHVLDVRARDEGLLPRAGQDDDAHRLVLRQVLQLVAKCFGVLEV
jgi:hypothetical protein